MKKAVKGIIGLCAVLAVLGGGLAALKLTEPEDSGESVSTSSEASGAGVTLIKSDVVSGVKVTSEAGELNVVMKEAATDTSTALYTLEGYEDIPLTTSIVGTLVNNAKGLVSSSIVEENCQDFAKFGLDTPGRTVEVYFESGETALLEIGDVAPITSETYVRIDGGDTVYTVSTSKLSNYSMALEDFVSSTILEEPAEEDYPIIKTARVERDDLDYDIVIEYDEKSDDESYTGGTTATHVMTEPTFSYLAVERSTPITNGLFGLISSGVYSIHPEEADIAEAGLSQPFCRVTISCDNGTEYVLLMSEAFTDEDGVKCHYAMLEGGNIIYIVSAENAQWGTVMPIDIASKITIGTYVWNITDMTVKAQGAEDSVFTVKVKDGIDPDNASTSEEFDTTRNGEAFDTERYRSFYSFMVGTPAEDFAFDEPVPDTEPMLSIEFTESYENKTSKVEFYEYSALKALIVIDGESKYFCSKSFAETAMDNAARIGTGEEYVKTWK